MEGTGTEYATIEAYRAECLDQRSEVEEGKGLDQQRMTKRSLSFTFIFRELLLMLRSEKDRSDQGVGG